MQEDDKKQVINIGINFAPIAGGTIEEQNVIIVDSLSAAIASSAREGADHHHSPQPEPDEAECTEDYTTHAFARYVVVPGKAQSVLHALHVKSNDETRPKYRLLPLRAALEVGLVQHGIPCKDFVAEFGDMASTTYSKYINGKTPYTDDELEPLLTFFSMI